MSEIRQLVVNSPRLDEPIQLLVLYLDEFFILDSHSLNESQANLIAEFRNKWVYLHAKKIDSEEENEAK